MTTINPACNHPSPQTTSNETARANPRGSNFIADFFESLTPDVKKVNDSEVGASLEINLTGFFDNISKKLSKFGPVAKFVGNLGKNWSTSMRGFGKLFRGDIGGGLKDIFKGSFLGPVKNAFNLTALGWMSFLSKKVKVE